MIKYLKGALSPAEQHRVEKILLEEGFEAEAMEGFSGMETEDIEKYLNHLDERLHKHIDNRPAFGILRVAATILLLALFSFGVYFLVKQQTEEKQISYNIQKAASEKGSSMIDQSVEEMKMPEGNTTITDTDAREEPGIRNEAEEGPLAYNSVVTKPEKRAAAKSHAAPPARKSVAEYADKKEQEPGIVPEKQSDLSGVVAESDEFTVVSEAVGEKDKTMENSFPVAEGVNIGDLGKAEQFKMIRSERAGEPPLEISDRSGKRQEQFAKETKNEDDSEAVEIVDDRNLKGNTGGDSHPARPSIGMDAFKKYIKENMRYPEEMKNTGIKGKVVVAFTVDVDGKIKYLHIEKSLGNLFDKEAVRLIVEGPGWLPQVEDGVKKDSKVRVRLRFMPPRK